MFFFRKLFPRRDKSQKKDTKSADPALAVGGATLEVPAPDNHSPLPNVNENKPVKLSSYVVDPTAAYENESNWKSTVYASAGLAIEVLKETSDAFTPLKSVVSGLSVILKYYDVRHVHSAKRLAPLTFGTANNGES